MDDNEAFYDAEIVPALIALREKCLARGMHLLAYVSYADGCWGATTGIDGNAPLPMRLIDACAKAKGNFDAFTMAMMRYAQEYGHESVILMRLGVPPTPAPNPGTDDPRARAGRG